MTNQSHPSPSGAKRRWFQFSLRWLLAIVFFANLFFAWYLYTPPRWDRVRLHVDADLVRVDERNVPWQELAMVLQSRKERIRESGVELEDVRVQISVNGEAAYADFKRAVQIAWECGLRRVELIASDKSRHYDIGRWSDCPRFIISLQADSNGNLYQIRTPTRSFNANASLAIFQKDIKTFVGDDTGPNSLRELVVLTLACDDNLRFKHVAAVLEANTENPKSGGPRIPILRHIAILQREDVIEVLRSNTKLNLGLLDGEPRDPKLKRPPPDIGPLEILP